MRSLLSKVATQWHELGALNTIVKIMFIWSETCRNDCWLGTISTTYAVKVISVRVQKCSNSKNGMSTYILEFLESNWSAYGRCWIKCDVDQKRSIGGGDTTEHVMAGKDYAKTKGTRVHKIIIEAL